MLAILFMSFDFLVLLKNLNRIANIGKGYICLREENKKIKGPKQDSQHRLRLHMSEGGEQENQRTPHTYVTLADVGYPV
jgi:hypothetical protein